MSEPAVIEATECTVCGAPTEGVFLVPGGCVALPGIETQALCPQHVHSVQQLGEGPVERIAVWT